MNEHSGGLKGTDRPLVDVYDCAMLDLDGVVYLGADAVPGVPELLAQVRRTELALAFVTNNAARTPAAIAHHLHDLGIEAHESDIVTSAQAAAALIAEQVPHGSRVLVVGGEGLILALRERGLVPVSSGADDPVIVVQGFHPSVGWTSLAEAAYVIRNGVPWIAANLDLTVPTARGIAPGNGALVNAVAAAAGRRPDAVAGKPYRPLFDETVRRIASNKPLVVGDRLDTDIEGAVNCAADSLLVMTGVTDVHALCQASARQRPTFVSHSLASLFSPHPHPEQVEGRWRLGGWSVAVDNGQVVIPDRGPDDDDGLRVLAAACWDWTDKHPGGQLDPDALNGVLHGAAAARQG